MKRELFIQSGAEVLYNCCTKYYPDGDGGYYPVKRIVFDRGIYNPQKMELVKKIEGISSNISSSDDIIAVAENSAVRIPCIKSFNRARQKCYDYLMCNFDLDTFVTFTINPQLFNAMDYDEICTYLSIWLSNRVSRHNLKYILVPERHKSGAIHFHGIMNFGGLKLRDSGYYKVGKYTLPLEKISKNKMSEAQKIYNVEDLKMGFSTAIHIEGESAQTKISKYIWKYMTKQGLQMIGGRFYLHGGDLAEAKLVYSNELYMESDGVEIKYGSTACKIEKF